MNTMNLIVADVVHVADLAAPCSLGTTVSIDRDRNTAGDIAVRGVVGGSSVSSSAARTATDLVITDKYNDPGLAPQLST